MNKSDIVQTKEDQLSTHHAYITGALTNLPNEDRPKFRQFYESLAGLFEKYGLKSYVPHLYGDPVLFAKLTPREIDQIDRTAVILSGLVVAYVGEPSAGAGIEIELAYHANKPVILLFEKEKLEKRLISRLVRGNPAVVAEIVFVDFDDSLKQLDAWIPTYFDQIHKLPIPDVLKPILSR